MTMMFEDVQDATLDAEAEFAELMREIFSEAIMPQVMKAAKAKWAVMSADEKERFKNEHPDEYKAFMKGMEDAK